MEKYAKAQMEVIEFESEDVITTSSIPIGKCRSFSEASRPGARRTAWQSLSKRYTNSRYGRLRMRAFFKPTVIIPHPGLWF